MATAKPISRGADPKVVPAVPLIRLDLNSEPPQVTDVHSQTAAYDAASEAYDAVLRTVDTVVIGREPTEAEIAVKDAAEAEFIAAEIALCAYVPRTLEESRAKAEFMALRRQRGHFDDDETFAALLRSVAATVAPAPDEPERQGEFDWLFERWALIHGGGGLGATEAEVDRGIEDLGRIESRVLSFRPDTFRQLARWVMVGIGIGPNGEDLGTPGARSEIVKVIIDLADIPTPADTTPPEMAEAAQSLALSSVEPAPANGGILSLHREWYDLRVAANRHAAIDGRIITDEEMERLFYRRTDEIEDKITATPSKTATDLAVKALIAHGYGDHSCLDFENDPFWQEARRLVGCPMSPHAASQDPNFVLGFSHCEN